MSHPMRVRGLKLSLLIGHILLLQVAPHAGAWIETFARVSTMKLVRSHPMRVRGLKHIDPLVMEAITTSHPMRVRGLKRYRHRHRVHHRVAPHAGAWIET